MEVCTTIIKNGEFVEIENIRAEKEIHIEDVVVSFSDEKSREIINGFGVISIELEKKEDVYETPEKQHPSKVAKKRK